MMLPPSAASFRCSSDPSTTNWGSDPGKHFSEHFFQAGNPYRRIFNTSSFLSNELAFLTSGIHSWVELCSQATFLESQ